MDVPFRGRVDSGNELKKGGLSSSIWPNYSSNLPSINRKRKIGNSLDPSKMFCQIDRLKNGAVNGSSPLLILILILLVLWVS